MIRGALYLTWFVISVIPYASVLVIVSAFVRGKSLYWFAVGWLRQMTVAARLFGGIRYEVARYEPYPAARWPSQRKVCEAVLF